jgi:hypothetical protein
MDGSSEEKFMITEFDVYAAFRRAQANHKGTGYRLPKDWKKHSETKMTDFNRDKLYKMMVHFNTTYSNVDMDKYMACGFQIWSGFTYKHFCDQKIMNLYMQHDKQKKRQMQASVNDVDKTFAYIATRLQSLPRRSGYSQLQNFCKFSDGEVKLCINTYLKGMMDTTTLVYCIYKRYINLTDDERALTPYISERYRELVENMLELKSYIEEKERLLDGNQDR